MGAVSIRPGASPSGESPQPVCLTAKQREQFYLAPEPPDWCITGSGNGLDAETDPAKWQPKWPYHTQAWKDWLIAKRAGKNPEMPKD